MVVTQAYDPIIVLISYGVAFLGSYVAICLCEQLRSSYLHGQQNNLCVRIPWLLAIGSSLGGVGIWCMHFIGMSALTLYNQETGTHIQMGFNLGESLASLIIVIAIVSIATTIASNDILFAKSKSEILEMFVSQASHMTMNDIKRIKNSKVIWLISTKKLLTLILGGIVAAGGVCIMHYIGMDAMEFNQPIVIKWNYGIVVASVFIAIFAATAAYWILFRFLSIYPGMESLRIASALIMGVAVCGMHYTGMIAATFELQTNSTNTFTSNHIPMNHIIIPVLLSAFLLLWTLNTLVLFDLRRLIIKYRHYIQIIKGKDQTLNSALNSKSIFELMDEEVKHKRIKPMESKSLDPTSLSRHTSVHVKSISKRPVLSRGNSYRIPEEQPIDKNQIDSLDDISPSNTNLIVHSFTSNDENV